MDRTEYINEWKRILAGLPFNDIDQIVAKFLENGYTVLEVNELISKHGTDNTHLILQRIGFIDGLVRSHIIRRIEANSLKIECKDKISVSDIETVIRTRRTYLHPEDIELLQAAETRVIKEVPSEELSNAELICESDRIFIVFFCGNKGNSYRVKRGEGTDKCIVEKENKLKCLNIECENIISGSDIRNVIIKHTYLHPADKELLHAAETRVIKEVPTEALSSAEVICESDRIFIVFCCGNKDNIYRVKRGEGKDTFIVERENKLYYLKVKCKDSIKVRDVEKIIRKIEKDLQPEDRQLLQAVVTYVIKKVPSEALSNAEVMCENDRIFIVFQCGNKENNYRVTREEGIHKFVVEKGKKHSSNMSPLTAGLIGSAAGIVAGAAVGAILGGPVGLAIGMTKGATVGGAIGGAAGACIGATVTQKDATGKIGMGLSTGAVAGVIAGGIVAGPAGLAVGAVVGGDAGLAVASALVPESAVGRMSIGTAAGVIAGAAIGGIVAGPIGATVGAMKAGAYGAAVGGVFGLSLGATTSVESETMTIGIGMTTGVVGGAVIGGTIGGPMGMALGAKEGAAVGAVTGGVIGGISGTAQSAIKSPQTSSKTIED